MHTVDIVPPPGVRDAGSLSRRLLRWSAAALATFLLLDLARSLIAHFGYTEPVSIWQPSRAEYADVDWPPGAHVPAGASRGQRLFAENCTICHGPEGRGNGAAAPSMSPRPRDLTGPAFKYKSTPERAPPSRDGLHAVVAKGLAASAMPGFGDVLSDSDIDALVDFVVSLRSPTTPGDPPPAIAVPPRPPVTPADVANGERLYAAQGCAGCHGTDLRGGVAMADAAGQPVIARDLTAPWTFRGGAQPAEVFLRLTTGLSPSPMPAYSKLSEQDRWDLVAFLEARRRVAPGEPGAVLAGPGESEDTLARGRYLVRSSMCGLCHTEVSRKGIYRDDQYLAGGMRVAAHPQGVFVSRNLTPDPETGLGRWTDEDIARAIREGRSDDGRLLNVWSMPWIFLHNIAQPDAMAIARYLKTLPPVHNEIPRPLHYGAVETVLSKLLAEDLMLGRPPVITYASGSFANRTGLDLALVQNALVTAQWIVIILWVGVLAMMIPVHLWIPLGRRSWTGVLGCSLGLFVYSTPILGVLPADMVAREALRVAPPLDTSGLTAEKAALVERGRYLFTTASCLFCHRPDGGGGLKLSGLPGTLFTSNISSDENAGIGAWTDAEIARAIRSGVGRRGRPLYWQAMPWDHFSNFDEEDVIALTAYLRRLPPVPEKVPAYRPPSAEDCTDYTVWTSPNPHPGCR